MESVDKRINEKFEQIESKLRNSFQAFKADMDSIKSKLSVKQLPDTETKRDLEFLKERLGSKFSEIEDQITKAKPTKQDDSALRELTKQITELKTSFDSEIKSLKKQVAKTGIKEDISKELNEKLDSNLDIIAFKLKENKKESEKDKENLASNYEKAEKKSREIASKEKEELTNEFKSEVSKLRKEIANTKNDFSNKLEEKQEKIENLQRQISYLKGRINLKQPEEKQEIKEDEEVAKERSVKIKVPFKLSAWIKFLIVLIPLALIGFVVYANFVAAHDFTYSYDIGGLQDAKKPYLTPLNRVSDIGNTSNITYRNLTANLAYFDVPIPRGSNNFTVSIRLEPNFPQGAELTLGAKNGANWTYSNRQIYYQGNSNQSSQWITLTSQFDLKDLYISNGKLNMMLTIPHLGKNQTQQYSIPVDSINITVHKNGN